MNTKYVLVTGGSGFIGSNFIIQALKLKPDWNIINLDALTYAGNPLNLSDLWEQERYKFIHGNIKDSELLSDLFSKYNIRSIFHFAAESHVDRSIYGPEEFLNTNVIGTFRLLEESMKHWKKQGKPSDFRFIHVSTDEVFGSLGPEGAFSENSPYDPSSPYSASKASSDHFVRAYYRTYNLPTIITNCSNNYGPYQFPEKLIPLIIMNIIEKKDLPVYGDGSNVRDWLYVIDHCEAIIEVYDKGKPGETYNIGGGVEKKNIELVHILCDLLDARLKRSASQSAKNLICFVKDRPGHDTRYAIDSQKIENEIGWKARFTFEEALASTVDWYMNNTKWIDSIRSGEYLKWIKRHYQE